jgi:hypothetical protein
MKTIKRAVLSVSASAVSALFLVSGCVSSGADDTVGSGDVEGTDGEHGEAVALTGKAQVTVTDLEDGDGYRSESKYYLLTGSEGEAPVELIFRAPPLSFEPGDEVLVKGWWQGEGSSRSIVVDSVISSSAQAGGPEDAMSVIGGRPPTAHKAAILMAGSMQITTAQARAMLSTLSPGTAAAFIAENSGMIDTFQADAFAFPNIDTSTCGQDTGPIKTAAMTAFKNAGHDPSDYTNIVYVLGGSCPWFANATVGSPGSTGQQVVTMSEKAFSAEDFAHEVGHNLGHNHAHSTRCGANVYNAKRSGCTDAEYGNLFDAMGISHSSAPSGHYSAPKKRFMGYLSGCEDVTAGGGAVFQVSPTEGSCGMRSLRIPIAGESNYYYLEYHKPGAGLFDDSIGSGGVLLNVSDDPATGSPNTYLLDGTPETSTFNDAFLVVGKTYNLPGNVSITVQSLGDVATIKVTMPSGNGAKCQDGTTPPSSGGKVGGLCTAIASMTYQAENATSHFDASIGSSVSGHTGAGYLSLDKSDSKVEWGNVSIPRYSVYKLTFRYANPTGSSKTLVVGANGLVRGGLPLPPTGALPNWGTASVTMPIGKGTNKIQIGQTSGVLIDQVLISPN